MELSIYLVTLIGTALVLVAAFTSLIAFRFGAPLLLVFLSIGLIAGDDGLGIAFDNAPVAYFVGSLALAVILFDSGFGTSIRAFRLAALPAVTLATLGVVLTAALTGAAARIIMGLDWPEALLLGSMVGSTDAAAVFFLLRTGNVAIRERVRSVLEVESGSNDPIAIFLTLTLVSAISAATGAGADQLAATVFAGFVQQMGIGIVLGLTGGWVIVQLVHWLALDRGLVPIFVIALSLMVFGIAGVIGGSGFLAVYVAGLIAGNRLRMPRPIKRFQDGMSWLAQITMFLVLGLFATPSQFPALLLYAGGISLFLIFVARPLAVAICVAPFRFPRAETAFVSWVGLRGAVSILLALTPLLAGLENGRMLFNTVFMVVMISLLIQGWTISPLARRLGLVIPPRIGPLAKFEVELPGVANHELIAYRITDESPVVRGSRIPRWARPSLVVRAGRSMAYQYAGRLKPGDHVYIFVPSTYPPLLDRLFASPAEVRPDDMEFFGEFTVDPARPARGLEAAYNPGLSPDEGAMPVAELMLARLGGNAEYADRVPLGDIELIVRDVDDSGAITSVGLTVEPQFAAPRIPPFLSLAELSDRVRAWWAARQKSAASASEDSAEETGADATAGSGAEPLDAPRPDVRNQNAKPEQEKP